MPPYKAPVSEAQRRYLFVLEREGKLRPGEARGKSRALRGRKLPRHVGGRRRKARKARSRSRKGRR